MKIELFKLLYTITPSITAPEWLQKILANEAAETLPSTQQRLGQTVGIAFALLSRFTLARGRRHLIAYANPEIMGIDTWRERTLGYVLADNTRRAAGIFPGFMLYGGDKGDARFVRKELRNAFSEKGKLS